MEIGRGSPRNCYPNPDGESKRNCEGIERNLAVGQIEIRQQVSDRNHMIFLEEIWWVWI